VSPLRAPPWWGWLRCRYQSRRAAKGATGRDHTNGRESRTDWGIWCRPCVGAASEAWAACRAQCTSVSPSISSMPVIAAA
jgi:hypothetical protein